MFITDVAVTPAPVIAMPVLFDAVAVSIGALSGAFHAERKKFDVIGVLAVAFATGLGGGVIRDVILERGTPAFLTDPSYLLYAAFGAVVGLVVARRASRFTFVFNAVDVATLGVWVLIGCQKSAIAGLPAVSVVFVGVVASVGGGLLRDLLCGEVPSTLRPGEWLAFASFLAALTYVVLNTLDTPLFLDETATLVVAAGFRWATLRAHIRPPMPMDLTARWRPQSAAEHG